MPEHKQMIKNILIVSVGLIAVFYLAMIKLVAGHAYFQSHRLSFSLAVGLVGLALWGFGRRKHSPQEQPAPPPPELAMSPGEAVEDAGAESFFLQSAQYWGPMLIVFSLMVYLVHPPRPKTMPPLAAATPAPPVSQAQPTAQAERVPNSSSSGKIVPPEAPAEFPKVKIQGINISGSHPSVIINGRSYFVGDRVGAAVITAIDRQGATLELSGRAKVLYLQR